jgi:quinoprotein glucose dehydrogenase
MRATSAAAALLLAGILGQSAAPGEGTRDHDWPAYGGDPGHTRFSALDQITPGNVGRLVVAWRYRTGDADPDAVSTIECTPIVVDGTMYLTTVLTKVVALDAASGRERWVFDPYGGAARKARRISGGVNRGVAYWRGSGGAARVLVGTADGRLISLDAFTGRPDPAFGTAGIVDLRGGLEGDYRDIGYGVTSAPGIFEDLAIVGVATPEGPGRSAPGDVRAFSVRTGREVWRFHTVPRPGEFGHDTWEGDGWKDRGGANPWSGVSVDAANRLVFVATGSPSFDFYGGDRKGRNLFANSVVALDARTGARRWHFQTVRHDLWDYDLPTPPVLVTVRRGDRAIEAVAQPTKMGHLFVLDRKTGEPLFPVEERPVPASDVPGEAAWPTQVFPLRPAPFARQGFRREDATDRSPEAREQILGRLQELRHGSIFTPPSLAGTVLMPGTNGGANWSGASFDPARGVLYVNSSNWPALITLVRPDDKASYPYGIAGYVRFTDADGYPGSRPPWGLLTAIDLNTGDFVWQVPLGEFPELARRGRPRTGTPTFGGSIATASGIVFIGGTMDEKLRAFDARTGEVLWEHQLDAGAYATPATYMVDGRQFVAVAAGGGGKLRTKSGDAFVAFALPDARSQSGTRR